MDIIVFGFFDMLLGWMRSQTLWGVLVGGIMMLAGLAVFIASLYYLAKGDRVELKLIRFEDTDLFKKKDLEEGEEHSPSWFPVYQIVSGPDAGVEGMGNIGCKHDAARIGQVSKGLYFKHGHGQGQPSLTALEDVKNGLWVPFLFIALGLFVILWFGHGYTTIPTMDEMTSGL